MIILAKQPPNIDLIREKLNPPKGVIFTFGDILYNPDNIPIDTPLLAHEEIHARQQKDFGVDRWWLRYLNEPAFRASQEVEAYQVQYREGKKIIKDRNRLALWLHTLASTLSGEIYGNCMTLIEAKGAIRSERLIRFDVKL